MSHEILYIYVQLKMFQESSPHTVIVPPLYNCHLIEYESPTVVIILCTLSDPEQCVIALMHTSQQYLLWFHCLGVSPWHIDCYLHAYEGRIWLVPTYVAIQSIMISYIHHLMIVCQPTEAIKVYYLPSSSMLIILLKIIVSMFRFRGLRAAMYKL